MHFHKIARTNHTNNFEFLAILLYLELVYCENAVNRMVGLNRTVDNNKIY